MAAAYIEHRPKSTDKDAGVSHYVIVSGGIEKHGTFKTQREAKDKAFGEGYNPVYVARVRHLQNRGNPDHFRRDLVPATEKETVSTSSSVNSNGLGTVSAWVEKRNDKLTAQIFASRASMLVLPNVAAELSIDAASTVDKRASQGYYLNIFRSLAISSYAASNAGSDMLSASISTYKALAQIVKSDDFAACSAYDAVYAAGCSDAEDASHFAALAVNNALVSESNISRKKRIIKDLLEIMVRSIEENNTVLFSLARGPLWLGHPPRSAVNAWRRLAMLLLRRNEGWSVWIEWYNAKLVGSNANTNELERLVLRSPEELWVRDAIDVNEYLEVAMNEFNKRQKDNRGGKIPDVPPVAAAAIEPLVVQDRIILPKKAASASLDIKTANASLRSLKKQVQDLQKAAEDLGNIDHRTLAYLHYIEDLIPKQVPSQDKLFDLAHQLETLESFSKNVNDEWPEILASRYHSFVRAFDRTIDQFPKWREFRRNFTIGTFGSRQIEAAPKAAKAFSEFLRDPNFSKHIDPDLPNAIASLGETRAMETSPLDQVKEEVAADIVESINNTLKTLASVILSPLHKVWGLAKDVMLDYSSNFEKGLRLESAKEGEKAGRGAFRWASKILVGSLSAYATTVGMKLAPWLADLFPHQFSWLMPVLMFITSASFTNQKEK